MHAYPPVRERTDSNDAIRIGRLSKRFGEVVAVDELSLTVSPGEIFGFLGPNGAGKSTTIRLLLGLIRPDGGDAFGTRAPLLVLEEPTSGLDPLMEREFRRRVSEAPNWAAVAAFTVTGVGLVALGITRYTRHDLTT